MSAETELTSQTTSRQEISSALEAVDNIKEVVGQRIKSLLIETMKIELNSLPKYNEFECGYYPLMDKRLGGQGIVLDFGQHNERGKMIVLEEDGIFEIPHELKTPQFIYTLSWKRKREIKSAEYLDFVECALSALAKHAKIQSSERGNFAS